MDWDFPGKHTGKSCHFLSPGEKEPFPNQRSNAGLPPASLHCRQVLYRRASRGARRVGSRILKSPHPQLSVYSLMSIWTRGFYFIPFLLSAIITIIWFGAQMGPGLASVSPLSAGSCVSLSHPHYSWCMTLFSDTAISDFLIPASILSGAKIREPSNLNSDWRTVAALLWVSSCLWAWAFLPCLRFSSSANWSSRPLLFFHWGCRLLCRCFQKFLVRSKHCSFRHCDLFTLNIFLLTLSIGFFGQNSFIWT